MFTKFKVFFNTQLGRIGYQVVRGENSIPVREFMSYEILTAAKGVLHIGAHFGEERFKYSQLKLSVLWIEAVPDFFNILQRNIEDFENQQAIQLLLSDHEREMEFKLANNEGASSSIYDLSQKSGFEDSGLAMIGTISLQSSRLDQVFETEQISGFDHWVIDVQGAELEVLMGAGDLLNSCNSLEVEVSRREIYNGGTTYHELIDFLKSHGFIQLWEARDGEHMDVLFIKRREN
jgi:FkbM family methyltransferase